MAAPSTSRSDMRKRTRSTALYDHDEQPKRPCNAFYYYLQAQKKTSEFGPKEQYDNSRVKRPCNAYMMFMKDFIKNRFRDFRTSKDVVSAGAAAWNAMTSIQKAPWNRLSEEASRTYQAQKNLQRSNVVKSTAKKVTVKKSTKTAKECSCRLQRLWSQWQQLDARAKAPYEARAAQDAERYRRENRK